MEIRPETADDVDAVRGVVAAAFGSTAEAELVDRLRASPQFVPGLSLVADDGGEIVGHVLVTEVELVDGDVRRTVLSLAPLAVTPARQRSGIGSALVRAVVARMEERGDPLVVLQGSPAYYGRLGFEPAAGHGITMALPEWAPPEAAQVLRLRADDASIRGHVVYPEAFDDLSE